MARRRFTPEELNGLRELASQWGKIVARRAFGDDGPGLDVDFDAMEQIAQAAARGRRVLAPRVPTAPAVVAVEVDGGRLRTRAAGCGPGVHAAEGKEDKIACLVTLTEVGGDADPQPEPPPSFVEPRRIQRLVQQMAGRSGDGDAAPAD